jgi:hypothetical protein
MTQNCQNQQKGSEALSFNNIESLFTFSLILLIFDPSGLEAYSVYMSSIPSTYVKEFLAIPTIVAFEARLEELSEKLRRDTTGLLAIALLRAVNDPWNPVTPVCLKSDSAFFNESGLLKRETSEAFHLAQARVEAGFKKVLDQAKAALDKVKHSNPDALWLSVRLVLNKKSGNWRDGPDYTLEEEKKAYAQIFIAAKLGSREAQLDFGLWSLNQGLDPDAEALVVAWLKAWAEQTEDSRRAEYAKDILKRRSR